MPGVYPGGFTLALGSLWHSTHKEGKGKAAVAGGAHLPLQSIPPHALPQLSLSPHLPRARRLPTPLPFPWSWAIPFTHSVLSHQNPVAQLL